MQAEDKPRLLFPRGVRIYQPGPAPMDLGEGFEVELRCPVKARDRRVTPNARAFRWASVHFKVDAKKVPERTDGRRRVAGFGSMAHH